MKLNIIYLLSAALFFIACEKKEVKVSSLTSKTTLQSLIVGDDKGKDGTGKEDCFELVYPLSITMPDGSNLTGNKEDLWDAVKSWYEANPNSEEKPNLNYPVDIIFDNGGTQPVADETEMESIKKDCE